MLYWVLLIIDLDLISFVCLHRCLLDYIEILETIKKNWVLNKFEIIFDWSKHFDMNLKNELIYNNITNRTSIIKYLKTVKLMIIYF